MDIRHHKNGDHQALCASYSLAYSLAKGTKPESNPVSGCSYIFVGNIGNRETC